MPLLRSFVTMVHAVDTEMKNPVDMRTGTVKVYIKRCRDPRMWYVDRIGGFVTVAMVSGDGAIWGRDSSGHLNIIERGDIGFFIYYHV